MSTIRSRIRTDGFGVRLAVGRVPSAGFLIQSLIIVAVAVQEIFFRRTRNSRHAETPTE